MRTRRGRNGTGAAGAAAGRNERGAAEGHVAGGSTPARSDSRMPTAMSQDRDNGRARGRRRLRRSPAGGLLVFAVLILGITAGVAVSRPFQLFIQKQRTPFVLTDRAVKLRMLDKREDTPRLLVFGGSRASRVEPARFEKLTGLPGFNLSFQNGRPEDAWAFVNLLHDQDPGTPIQVVWLLHVEAFREQGLSPGLVQDERLSHWFPSGLIAAEKKKLPQTEAELPEGTDLALTTYGPDGVVLRNRYDIAVEKGRTLKHALAGSIDQALERYATTSPALFPRSTEYFEKTLALLDEMDTQQVIVLTPLHPKLLAAVKDAGWGRRHSQVVAYLRRQQAKYGFSLLDFSRLSSIGGDPDAFYDGFHFKRSNARKLVDAVVARAPEAFGLPAGVRH